MSGKASKFIALVMVVVMVTAGSVNTGYGHTEGITIRVVWDFPPEAPVFDCTDPQVQRKYPAQCPEVTPPFLLGGSRGGGGGGGGHSGLLGRIIDAIGGVVSGGVPGIPGI